MYHDIERVVLDHDQSSNGEYVVTRAEAGILIASGYYRKSTGFPYSASHFRRSLDNRSCLHLVVDGDGGRLHHDAFDPHSGPLALCMHLTHEAKSETVSYCAVAWSLVKLLAG